MDFRVLGLDGLVGPQNSTTSSSTGAGAAAPLKASTSAHEQPSGPSPDGWKASKMEKTEDLVGPKAMSSLRSACLFLSSESGPEERMLSFSSVSKPEATITFLSGKDDNLAEKSSLNLTGFAYHQHSPFARSAGWGSGSLDASLPGGFSVARGPFTPSQWMELEHQALIYKYITSNAPLPSNLLTPLTKSLHPYVLSGSSPGSYPSSSLGWGTFHLGYLGNTTDPEPGRCRRTDGKKWRCSRDAVADQKYCERHMNRGRHRSRKPVEGQTGHTATGTTNSKVVPKTSSLSTSAITSGVASGSFTISQQQFQNLQLAAGVPSVDGFVNRDEDPQNIILSAIDLKSEGSTFTLAKQDIPLEESSHLQFGLVSSESLVNPSHRRPKNFESFLNLNDNKKQDQHPLRQFFDDWPKDHCDRSVISWPEEIESDWTQLSMSIPMASSGFPSSSTSPARGKLALSPLPCEFDTSNVGMRVNGGLGELGQKQTNWIPIPWETSMGGPLGEVLSTRADNEISCENASALNLVTEGWDGSPQFGSSPTGVLQKTTFDSLSSCSSGCSPGAETKNSESATACNDVLGPSIFSSSPIPLL